MKLIWPLVSRMAQRTSSKVAMLLSRACSARSSRDRRSRSMLRLISDDVCRGPDPQFLQQPGLALGPGDELVQLARVQPGVLAGQDPQRAPPGRLALHAQPEHLQLFQAAQRGPGGQVPVELQAAGFL